ncbi:hypothetical protein GGR52DRAFT_577785 [Hypoxylon sp. FL1284]|nr:hypothetical protein GGR52DRAFT_577785 [Hypoxylon sp. FL1284]
MENNDFEDPADHEDGEFPADEPLDDEDGGFWQAWWEVIVHRNVAIFEPVPDPYPADTWTLMPKEPPFPFNISEISCCASLLVLILAIHCELDTQWLLSRGIRHYIMRVSLKVVHTVALSFASTLAYEILGNVHELFREEIEFRLRFNTEVLQRLLSRGRLDESVVAAVCCGIGLLFQCMALLISSILGYVGPATLTWFVSWISTSLAGFISNLSTTFALPTPGADGIVGLESLMWEFGAPAYFQVWIAAFLYLLVFLFISLAETPVMALGRRQDPFCKLALELLRATAMHLLAFTAYQLVCICVVAINGVLLGNQPYDPLIHDPLVQHHNYDVSPGAGMLILAAHWLIKRICKLHLCLLRPFWVPYTVWLSIMTRRTTESVWHVYWELICEDMEVLNPDKRVLARVMMTFSFGLKSSWPARMRLSTLDGID